MRLKKLLTFLSPDNTDNLEIDTLILRRRAMADNIRRGRILAIVIVCFELIFAIADISALMLRVSMKFHYLEYLILYGLMILASLLFLSLARRPDQSGDLSLAGVYRQENALLLYITFNMIWGSLIALLDQELYGQVIVFMVNMIANSIVFIIHKRRLLIPYLLSAAVLFIGLPFFQPSSDILVGHYVNMAVFICISWTAAQLQYQSYVRNLASNLELERAIRLLAAESAQNKLINDKLSQANLQLRQLSLIDELTGLANRRGLRNFISQVFEQQEQPIGSLSVMMIDIDHFKQYNDHYGHFAGDQVLVSIAGVLANNIRSSWDIAARWGGEEFVLLSFNGDQSTLAITAECVRQQVEDLGIVHESSPDSQLVTVSIGTSYKAVQAAADAGPAIEAADIAMYEAKKSGRNRVVNSLPEQVNPQPDIRIITATTREHAQDTAELARKIWTEHYTPIIGSSQVEYMLDRFQNSDKIWQEIREKGYQYDLLEIGGELAGYMASRQDDEKKAFFLSKLYVDQRYRRQGLGRQLLNTLINRCAQQGYRRIWLTVNKNNRGSIAAYEKLGFARVDDVVTDIGDGYVMDDYIMEMIW